MREDWEIKSLGEIASVAYGFTDKAFVEGEYRYVRITDIDNNGELTTEEKKYVQYSDEAKNFLLEDEDLLMARTGATFAKVLLHQNDEPSIFASYLIRIDFNEEIANKLYWYFSKSENYWEQAIRLSSGSAQPHFNGAALKKVVFTYPKSLTEQKQIVAILDQAFAAIDQAKVNIEKNSQNAKELFDSSLESLFEGVVKYENASTLNEICELIVDCEHKTAPTQDSGNPSIRTPNIGKGELILKNVRRVSEETYSLWTRRAIPVGGDLIMAREAPAGNVAIIPENEKVCLGQRTLLIRPKKTIISSLFLTYYLLTSSVQKRLLSKSTGATVQHVNMKDIRNLKIGEFPKLSIQREIENKVQSLKDKAYSLDVIYEKRKIALEELKKSILQKAFAGELTGEELSRR